MCRTIRLMARLEELSEVSNRVGGAVFANMS